MFIRYLRVLHLLQWKNNSNLGVNQYNLIWGQNSHKSTLSTDRKVASCICNVSTQRKVSNIGLKVKCADYADYAEYACCIAVANWDKEFAMIKCEAKKNKVSILPTPRSILITCSPQG